MTNFRCCCYCVPFVLILAFITTLRAHCNCLNGIRAGHCLTIDKTDNKIEYNPYCYWSLPLLLLQSMRAL